MGIITPSFKLYSKLLPLSEVNLNIFVKKTLHFVKLSLHLSKKMKIKLLLPYRYKKIGWFIFYPALLVGLPVIFEKIKFDWLNVKMLSIFPDILSNNNHYFSIIEVNLTNTLAGILFLVGALLVGFTEEKFEDEFIEKLRLSALLWAVLINYVLLLLAFLFIYQFQFINVMVFNMFTVLLLFIARFRYLLYKYAKN